MEPTPPTAPPSAADAPPVAPTQPASAEAAQLAAKHGGKASRRRDGLPLGSPEALEADRARDRERKRRKSAELRTDAPAAPLVARAEASALPQADGSPAGVPWTVDLLRPIFEQAVPLAEGLTVRNLRAKAEQAALPADLVREVEQGAAWNPLAKQQIVEGGSATAAKWLNTSGVSAEHADELRFLGGLVAVFAGYQSVARRLDEMALAANHKATKDTGRGATDETQIEHR